MPKPYADGRKRTYCVTLRLTPAEHDALSEKAREAGCSRGALIRRWIDAHPPPNLGATLDRLDQALRQLHLPGIGLHGLHDTDEY